MSNLGYKIFVACPFDLYGPKFRAVFASLEEKHGVEFVFGDHAFSQTTILSKVQEMVRESDFLICDITRWNPNVTLELGYGMGIGKEWVILFNPKEEGGLFGGGRTNVPTDLQGLQLLHYRNVKQLKKELGDWLGQQNPKPHDPTDGRLAHSVRIQLVLENSPTPLTTEQIEIKIGEKTADIVLPNLRALEDEGKVSRHGAGRYTKWTLQR